MKKLFIVTISIIAIGLTGCLKDKFGTDLYATGSPILEFEYPQGGGGSDIGTGLEYFGGGALLYPPTDLADTTFFIVNLASTNTLGKDVSITIGNDPKAILDNFSKDSINYVAMPDSDYQLLSTTATIKAGQRQDTFYIVFYPSKIDPTQNFMLPITVTSNTGNIPVSGNFGHIYFHTIGNPIAGSYDQEWIRYNASDTSGTPAYDLDLGTVIFAPLSPTQISVGSQGTGETDYISFTNTGGVLSNFSVAIGTVSGITEGTPVLETADPVNGIYRVYFTYVNGSGAPRCIINIYRKQ